MRLTEEEAKTKRCQEGFGPGPMSQSGGMMTMGMAVGATYTAVPMSPVNCIASGCMAWEWATDRTIDGYFTGFCGKARRLF